MKVDLGHSASILANVGVLAGLLLVAVQIHQNTEIAKAQLENDYYLADLQLELSMMGDAPTKSWIKAVYTPEKITPEDAAVLDRYFNYGLVQAERLSKMRQMGLAEDEVVEKQIEYLKWHLGNEIGRRWWARYRTVAADQDMVKRVDKALETANYQKNRELLDSLLTSATTKPTPLPDMN